MTTNDTETDDLYKTNSFFFQTRRRKIIKRVTECYLRDDLGYGSWYNASSGKRETLSSAESLLALCEASTDIAVCDTNVLLRNMDVLERLVTKEASENDTTKGGRRHVVLVFPETTLIECQSNSRVMYDRAADLIRSSGAIYFSDIHHACLLYTSPSPRDLSTSRMPSSA